MQLLVKHTCPQCSHGVAAIGRGKNSGYIGHPACRNTRGCARCMQSWCAASCKLPNQCLQAPPRRDWAHKSSCGVAPDLGCERDGAVPIPIRAGARRCQRLVAARAPRSAVRWCAECLTQVCVCVCVDRWRRSPQLSHYLKSLTSSQFLIALECVCVRACWCPAVNQVAVAARMFEFCSCRLSGNM